MMRDYDNPSIMAGEKPKDEHICDETGTFADWLEERQEFKFSSHINAVIEIMVLILVAALLATPQVWFTMAGIVFGFVYVVNYITREGMKTRKHLSEKVDELDRKLTKLIELADSRVDKRMIGISEQVEKVRIKVGERW